MNALCIFTVSVYEIRLFHIIEKKSISSSSSKDFFCSKNPRTFNQGAGEHPSMHLTLEKW